MHSVLSHLTRVFKKFLIIKLKLLTPAHFRSKMPNLLLISFLCFLCSLNNGVEADVAQKYAGYNEGYARFLLSFTSGAYSMTPKECIESWVFWGGLAEKSK